MKERGFSVVEAILACALFSLAGLCLFSMLQFGFRAFSIGGQRMGAQAEAETILLRLRADLESTTVASIRTLDGGGRNIVVPLSVGLTNQPRHILCCCGLTDWSNKANYDRSSGQPKWDRYLVYQADLNQQGGLYRLELEPTSTDVNDEGWQQFSNYCSAFPNLPPATGVTVGAARVTRRQRLTSRLLGFETTKASGDLVIRVLLYNEGYRGPTSGSKRSQVLETQTRIAIRNRSR